MRTSPLRASFPSGAMCCPGRALSENRTDPSAPVCDCSTWITASKGGGTAAPVMILMQSPAPDAPLQRVPGLSVPITR